MFNTINTAYQIMSIGRELQINGQISDYNS